MTSHKDVSTRFYFATPNIILRFVFIYLLPVLLSFDYDAVALGASYEVQRNASIVLTVDNQQLVLRASDFRERTYFKSTNVTAVDQCIDHAYSMLPERTRDGLKLLQKPGGRELLDHNPVSECIWNSFSERVLHINSKHSNIFTLLVLLTVEDGKIFPGNIPLNQLALNSGAPDNLPYEVFIDFFDENPAAEYALGVPYNAEPPSPGFDPRGTLEGLAVPKNDWPPSSCKLPREPGRVIANFENRGPVILPRVSLHDTIEWNHSAQYFLPAQSRLGNATAPLCVICGPAFVTSNQRCAIYLWSRDRKTRFGIMWWAGTEVQPSDRWIIADLAVRMMAHSIFIGTSEEEFQ